MKSRTIVISSLIVFGLWWAFNVTLSLSGQVKGAWQQPGLYSIGGGIFAILCIIMGLIGRSGDKEEIGEKLHNAALIPIIGGVSYFGLILLYALGYR